MPAKINLKDKVEDGEIDLSMSGLQDVPVKEIALVAKAHSLDLSNNHLSSLPKNFSSLTNLIKLDLSKNQLKELPDNFGNLVKLKHLDLYHNQLQHLPLSFSKLKALRWLDLKDNPLVPAIKEAAGLCLDNKQCQSCAKDIVIFYSNLEEQVIKERETREKQRQKDKLANELASQKLKQEKKLKKKEKPKKTEPDNEIIQEPLRETKGTIDASVIKKSKSVSFLQWVILLLLSLVSIVFFLTSINCQYTEVIEKETQMLWHKYVQILPPYLQEPSHSFGTYFKNAHEITGKAVNTLGERIIKLKDNIDFKPIIDTIYSTYNSSVNHLRKYCDRWFTHS